MEFTKDLILDVTILLIVLLIAAKAFGILEVA